MILSEQFGNGPAEVPQEAVAVRGTPHHAPRQHWHPRLRIVATTPGELRNHIVGPVLSPRLPAIVDHIPQTALAHHSTGRVLVLVEILIEVALHVTAV